MHMSYNVTLDEKCNFLNLITTMKEVLRIYGSKGLTLTERIQIFKSTALSKMEYISTMLRKPFKTDFGPIKFDTERFHFERPPS